MLLKYLASQFKPWTGWRSGLYYRQWTKAVRRRWDNTCPITGKTDDCVCHHLAGVSTHPVMRYHVGNGILLHASIHNDFHVSWMGGYHKPCTPEDFARFCRARGYSLKRKKHATPPVFERSTPLRKRRPRA